MQTISLNRLTYLLLVKIIFIIVPWYSVHADEKNLAPQQIVGVIKVNAEGVIEKVSAIPSLVFIDARIKSDRMQGHIEGSISLPDEQTNCQALEKLIPEFSTPVLFYCNGPKCGRSVTSSRIALKCGYSTIYWFRGGIEEWKDKKFPLIKNETK